MLFYSYYSTSLSVVFSFVGLWVLSIVLLIKIWQCMHIQLRTFTPTESGPFILSTCRNANIDVVSALFDDTEGKFVACNDDGPGACGGASQISYNGIANHTYVWYMTILDNNFATYPAELLMARDVRVRGCTPKGQLTLESTDGLEFSFRNVKFNLTNTGAGPLQWAAGWLNQTYLFSCITPQTGMYTHTHMQIFLH